MHNGFLVLVSSFLIACGGGSNSGSSTNTSSNASATTGPSNPAFIFSSNDISAYFSSNGGAKDAIVSEIQNAQKSIKIQAFALTVPDTMKALVSKDIRLDAQNLQAVKGTHPVVSAGLPYSLDSHQIKAEGCTIKLL